MRKALAPIVITLLAACTTAGATSAVNPAGKWRFIAIDGEKPVSSKAELNIEASRIGANVGCNGMGGDMTIKGGKLEVGGLVSTLMYCDGLMDQERAVSELLSASPDYRIEDKRLILRGGAHSAELVPVG